MKDNQYFQYLLDNYLKNTISEEEKVLFFELLSSGDYDDILSEDIINKLHKDTQMKFEDMSSHEADSIILDILRQNPVENSRSTIPFKKTIYYIASIAALLALIGFAYLFLQKADILNEKETSDLLSTDQYLTFKNDSDSIRHLVLSDNSSITIYPNSSIQYPVSFAQDYRIVRLHGTAFFQISPDKAKPFIVYSGKLKTQVLGTSFLVSTNSKSGFEEVEVKTGKVEVTPYELEEISDKEHVQSVILTPNQRVIYSHENTVLNKTLVSNPQPLVSLENNKEVKHKSSFEYDQVLIPTLLNELELEYGVRIVLDNSDLKNSYFTGSLSDTNLFTKLKIICLATQSSYEVDGTSIIIK